MSALVGYASSDEDDDIQPEKPCKISKTHENAPASLKAPSVGGATAQAATVSAPTQVSHIPQASLLHEPQGPAAGPHIPDPDASVSFDTPNDPSVSPYTFERQRLRELTMPPIPNFEIPESPPPPPSNSEEAAELAARTKKFERFFELKKQGVHFNARLQNSSSLRNPSLLPKLMGFADIELEDSYASTLPDGVAVPTKWHEECYVEALMKENERRGKKKRAERKELDFVPASKSGVSSEAGTPSGGKTQRKSKFDKR